MTEADVQSEIRRAVGLLPHARLFRNNRGKAWIGKAISRQDGLVTLANARRIEFGLFDGASDLIGLTQIHITSEWVGRTIAAFTAGEVKRPGETVPTHQKQFLDFVREFGGLADVVRSADDALRLVRAA